MLVLGLNHGEINSSAAIVKDGRVIAGAPEERFSREQRTKSFPSNAVSYCLAAAQSSLEQVDCVAQGWNPGASWQRFEPLLSSFRLRREDYFYSIPDNLWNFTARDPKDWVSMGFPIDSGIPTIYYVQHHRSHAANAFFLSPFEDAAILTCDWRGEQECFTWGEGRGNAIEILYKQAMPHSLGMFYSTFTELLGYRRDSDEWKVMALSAFDSSGADLTEKVRSTLRMSADGSFELDQSYYQGAIFEQSKLYTPKLVSLLGEREGRPDETPDDWHCAVAKAMQTVSEEVIIQSLCKLYERTKSGNLVLGGGFAMNSVLNGKLPEKTPFKNVYVSFAPADVGNSIGAALYAAHCISKQPRSVQFTSSYLGPEFTNDQVMAVLQRRGIRYRKLPNAAEQVAALLADGEIVAHFHGRMEFGERALGNRSILADPRKSSIKDKINATVKYREAYRPLAPAVLYEKAPQYFEVPQGYECHFMEKVVAVRKQHQTLLPGITHVDGSARVQTVRKEHNSRFYEIIERFGAITEVPVVVNTSFNVNGEPIVLSPDYAVTTFFNSGLRFLVIEDCLVEK